MTEWRQYERKRSAFERKWKVRIERVLNNQLNVYVESLRAGRPQIEAFNSPALTEALRALYGDVGGWWARDTIRNLQQEARRTNNATQRRQSSIYDADRQQLWARRSKGNNGHLQSIRLKRGSFFSLEWAQRMINRLLIGGLRMAAFISETSREKVLAILEEAQTENLSLEETIQRIVTEVREVNRRRAETIARTEVGRASGEGKMQGAKSLGVELTKKWVSARDFRTRRNPKRDPRQGDHVTLNGQVRELDEPFDNGVHRLMQPGDVNAPPSETIRCRCTVTFEVKKDPQCRAIERNYLTL